MKSTVFIPKLCKVGFNERSDTYSGKLAYVIYHDGKKWKKEESWKNWIVKYMSQDEFNQHNLDLYNSIAEKILKSEITNDYGKWFSYIGYRKGNVNTIEDAYKLIGPIKDFIKIVSNNKISTNIGIKPYEFDNIPIEGFVLNKKAGGTKTDGMLVKHTVGFMTHEDLK